MLKCPKLVYGKANLKVTIKILKSEHIYTVKNIISKLVFISYFKTFTLVHFLKVQLNVKKSERVKPH